MDPPFSTRFAHTTIVASLFLDGFGFRSSWLVESFSPIIRCVPRVLGWNISSGLRETDVHFFRISPTFRQRSIPDQLKLLDPLPFQCGEIYRWLGSGVYVISLSCR